MKKYVLYLLMPILAYFILNYFDQVYIYTDEFFYRNLATQTPVYSIDGILESRERYWWASYLIQIVVVTCKVLFASICIFIGVVLSDIELSFIDLFRSVIFAEFIFIIAQAIYLVNLFINRAELTFDTMSNYFPISMLSFYGTENVVSWLHYPLQTLNLFEVLYVIFISWLLSKKWKPDFIESLNILIPSYGIGLLLWMALVVFLTLQIS